MTGIDQTPQDSETMDESFQGHLANFDELDREGVILSALDQGRGHYRLAKLYYDKSDLEKAQKHFLLALDATKKPRDVFSIFKILGFLIRISSERLESDKAQSYIREANQLAAELPSLLGSLNAEYFFNLGVVKTYLGDFEQAKDQLLFAKNRAEQENDPELLAKTLLSLAMNAYSRKDFDYAIENISQLTQLLTIINKDYLQGAMHLFSAKIYLELGLLEKALDFFKLANETLQDKKCWNLYGYILLGKGTVFKRMGSYEKALLYFQLAMESIDNQNFKRLSQLLQNEINDVNNSNVDLYLDRTNRKIYEKNLGVIDFKHRFVLLEILFLLAQNPGTYFDKEYLAKSIWEDEYNPLIHDKLIYTSVSRLRKLIEPKQKKGDRRKYIIRGKDGYTFNPNVNIRFHMEKRHFEDKVIGNVEVTSPV